MVLLDTGVFVMDRFFTRDERHVDSQALLNYLSAETAGFYEFSLLELCGISSFNLSDEELAKWLLHFEKVYDVSLLPAPRLWDTNTLSWIQDFRESLHDKIKRKMKIGDAFILQAAEEYAVEVIITWNVKDFVNRTTISVLTPTEYLAQQEADDAE